MAENDKPSPEEAERIRQEEVDKLRKKDEADKADAAAAREAGPEQARPAVDVLPVAGSPVPTFVNSPSEGYKRNPANQTNMLPPERQAPRPADDSLIGQGRVKPSQQPPEKK